MSMLRDRLKKLSAQAKAETQERTETCLVCEERFPLLPDCVTKHAIELLFDEKTAKEFAMPKALFLDTETTGLSTGSGTVAFLVGVGYTEEDCFIVKQYLMRDYPEEESILKKVAEHLSKCSTIFSYNGKSFDVPLLRTRYIMTGLRQEWKEKYQADLLYPTRRIFKRRLLDCSLGNIEREVLHLSRSQDIPGALIPARYNQFLQKQDLSLLQDICIHNRQDIYSLYLLLHALGKIMEEPSCLLNSTDQYSLALHFQKKGLQKEAKALLTKVQSGNYFGQAQRCLSSLYRKEGAQEEAIEILKAMARRGLEGAFPFIELAKIYEHQCKDYEMALKITDYAIAHADLTLYPSLLHRRERLEKKKMNQKKKEESKNG